MLLTTNHGLLDIAYRIIKSEYCTWKIPKNALFESLENAGI